MRMTTAASTELLARWQGGDQEAARLLFRRYAEGLIALAQDHLPRRLSRRLDAEDVVQSAFRDFFAATRQRAYTLERSGDLWHLLATITLNRLRLRVEHHSARRRSVGRESDAAGDPAAVPEAPAVGPSAQDAAALADELEQILRGLDPLKRLVLELRLQDYTLDEIAARACRSERTVRRTLEQIKQAMERRALDRSA
jgi:RNA polymerase sigma-70 factor, ECF subfamily